MTILILLVSIGALLLVMAFASAGIFLLGRWFSSKKDRRQRFESSKKLYEEAYLLHKEGRKTEALVIASRALGEFETHETCNLIGHIVEELGEHRAASSFWSKARWCPGVPPDWKVYYYYREARAFEKEKNWEFALLRSRDAITMVEKGHLPAEVNGVNYEEQLRAILMYASLNHLHGSEGWEAAKQQAEWLKKNAKNSLLQRCGHSLSSADEARIAMTELLDNDIERL
ncbi:MAG TPA: hypothetical protein VNL73_05290 [Verrucomicrobiae bacterium]|nr:hypothetical protein [Verrucomicrobiae bacterium]